MAGPNRDNNNPPTLRSVNDVHAATEPPLNQYPVEDSHSDTGEPEIYDPLLMDLEAPEFLGLYSFVEEPIMINSLDLVLWRDFSFAARLSEDTIREYLKTRMPTEDDVREDKTCVICQDSFFQEEDKIATLDRGHEYHFGCIKNWLTRKNRCPLCNGTGIPFSRN